MAINFEHAWGDGVAVVRFLNETVDASSKDNFTPDPKADTLLTLQELNFNLDEQVKDGIKKGLTFCFAFLLLFGWFDISISLHFTYTC